MRYDPVTGQKVKVTADDPRFDEWSNRKPSKRSKLAKKIRERPGEYIAERATKVLEARTRVAATSLGRVVARSAPAALALGAAAASAAILAAGYVVMDKVARSRGIALGERANDISRKFTATQAAIMRAFNAGSWSQVPQDVRDKATNDYKRALGTLYAQAQGSALVGQRVEGSYK